MSEELNLALAFPIVKLLKVNPLNDRKIEVRAETQQRGLSLHYTVGEGIAPAANEKLLVAVLAGIYPEWFASEQAMAAWSQDDRDKARPITFTAVSALPRVLGSSIVARHSGHDTVHIGTVDPDTGLNRLRIWLRDEDDELLGSVVLSKGQVTSLLAALLAIYPRLEKN
jgi:hypothetical protein